MKKSMLALFLTGALLLSGCSAMLDRSYVSATAHVDYTVTEDDSIVRAETYQGLVNSILYFVNEHLTEGTIRLYNYTGDVEADLADARDEVLREDPVGAYAVRSLTYDSTRILTYYEVSLTVSYAHSAQEVEAIREITGLSGLRQELSKLVSERRRESVFMASYFSGSAELLDELLLLAMRGLPALYLPPNTPEGGLRCNVALYPETGTRRIVEIKTRWGGSEEAAAQYVQALEETAAALLEANPPEEEGYTPAALAAILRAVQGEAGETEATEEDPEEEEPAEEEPEVPPSDLALDALTGATASDTGLLLAMEYLCQQCGVEVVPVLGEESWWLIVATPEGYRHLLAESLIPPVPEPDGEEGDDPPPTEEFRLYTDQELLELGYAWNTALYPACAEYAAQTEETPV